MPQKDKVFIHEIKAENVPAVTVIEKECFSMPWSEKAFYDEIDIDCSVTLIAEKNTEICGFINGRISFDEFYINNIAVSQEFRRQKIGENLLLSLENMLDGKVKLITLEVRKSNIPAQKLYEKCGYIIVGERKNFYEKPTENAILMTKYFN